MTVEMRLHCCHSHISRTVHKGAAGAKVIITNTLDTNHGHSNRPGERSRSIDLRLDDVRALDEHFKHQWGEWIQHAPDSWKRDGYLTNNTPVAISMKYGQNQQVVRPDMTTIEARNWQRDRDYTHIKLFRFSIATHMKSAFISS